MNNNNLEILAYGYSGWNHGSSYRNWFAVFDNPNTPPEVYEKLVGKYTSGGIQTNSNCPKYVKRYNRYYQYLSCYV